MTQTLSDAKFKLLVPSITINNQNSIFSKTTIIIVLNVYDIFDLPTCNQIMLPNKIIIYSTGDNHRTNKYKHRFYEKKYFKHREFSNFV